MIGIDARRVVGIAFWAIFVLVGLGFLIVRGHFRAAGVLKTLEVRAQAMSKEAADARDARARHEQILAEIARERADTAPLLQRMPCELSLPALVPELRALLEPLGVTLRTEIGWKDKREFYEEARVPFVLPETPGAESKARAAIAALPRLILFRPYGDDARTRVLVILAYRCSETAPQLPAHRELIEDRERVGWPFNGAVVRKEREIEELRALRDKDGDALRDALLLQRLREDRERLAGIVAQLERSG